MALNLLNDIDEFKEWVPHLKTVFTFDVNIRGTFGNDNLNGVAKDPMLAKWITEFFTKKNDLVLDTFAGVGGILLGVSMAGRRGFGIELYQQNRDAYVALCSRLEQTEFPVDVGDAIEKTKLLENSIFDAIITDPPYGIGHKINRVLEGRGHSTFNMLGKEIPDIGSLPTMEDFYFYLHELAREWWRVIKSGRYLIVFLGDRYIKGRYVSVAHEAVPYIESAGFVLKGIKIWWQKNPARQVHAAYSKTYIPVIDHWNILVFKGE